jgi:hypothetical protein
MLMTEPCTRGAGSRPGPIDGFNCESAVNYRADSRNRRGGVNMHASLKPDGPGGRLIGPGLRRPTILAIVKLETTVPFGRA